MFREASRSARKNSPGLYGIPNELVVAAIEVVPVQVLLVFNQILVEGHLPVAWKRARLVLLQKGARKIGATFDPVGYRPLCLLSCLN